MTTEPERIAPKPATREEFGRALDELEKLCGEQVVLYERSPTDAAIEQMEEAVSAARARAEELFARGTPVAVEGLRELSWSKDGPRKWSRQGARIQLKLSPRGSFWLVSFDDGRKFRADTRDQAQEYADRNLSVAASATPPQTGDFDGLFADFRKNLAELKASRDELAEAIGRRPTPPDIEAIVAALGSEEVVEQVAKAVYDRFAYDQLGPPNKPAWVPRGNSYKQGDARQYARAALAVAIDAVKAAGEKGARK